jgi:hypothetical protein
MNFPNNQNYPQNMNMNNQNNPNNFKLFIGGRIGNKDIAREDLNTFMSSIKDFEWTDNNVYKQAKAVDIRPTFIVNQSESSNQSFQSNINNIDQLLLEENTHIRDFQQYKSDCDSRRVQFQDKILQKKKEFVDTFFSLNDKFSETAEKKELIDAIKLDKIKIIENSFLKEKLEKHIGYMKSQESAAVNYQFDFNSKLR